ncbi:MAG: hypothetical protein OIF54_06060, partial [Cohaesibacter sp.]|nr:hypothetical protein [Cohaesibacter sp.]
MTSSPLDPSDCLASSESLAPDQATLLPHIEQDLPKLVEWRRHLHQNPELGFEEYQTSAFIEKELHALGLETEHIAGTGLVASLRKGQSSRSI